jgi:hypothetical protein
MKVVIVFPSLLKLWSFKLVLQKRPTKISFKQRLITCTCTEAEIRLAEYVYAARVEELT